MGRALLVSILLVVIALIVVQIFAVPWWTAAPDSVRVTVIQYVPIPNAPDIVTTIFDRTAHDPALAQRLQRDLEALPQAPSGVYSCPAAFGPYDTYWLTWSRSGIFVEEAGADTTGCTGWGDFTLIVHERGYLLTSNTIYLDMHTLLGAPLPCFVTSTCPAPLSGA